MLCLAENFAFCSDTSSARRLWDRVLLNPRRYWCKLRDGTEGNRLQAGYWELALCRPIGRAIWWDPYWMVFRVWSNGTQNSGRTEERVAWFFRSEEAPIPMYYFKRRNRTREDVTSIIQYLPRMTVPTKRLRVTLVKVVNLWNTTNGSQCSSELLQSSTHVHARRHHTHTQRSGEDRPIWAGRTWW